MLVGDPVAGQVISCESGGGLCIRVGGESQPLDSVGTEPLRWGSDSVAYRVGDLVVVRPLGGIGKADDLGAHDAFATVAAAHGVSPQQVTLAWMLATAPNVVPIPGASRPETARDSAAAADLRLTEDELASLDASVDG